MKTRKCIPVLLVLTFLLCFTVASDLMALSLGKNITIWDKKSPSGSNSWYSNVNEDQEVEPNCTTGQQWDLEGFFLNGSQLSMVGGYNFTGYDGTTGGDIFIGTDNNKVIYGEDIYTTSTSNGNKSQTNVYGYNYVIRLSFGGSKTYAVYEINEDTYVSTGYYRQNDAANPWKANITSDPIVRGEFKYTTGLSNETIGNDLTGGLHNVISGLDLSFLGSGQDFTVHYTMSCGNDNLMGHGTVPEPASLFLLGTGLFGLAAGVRSRRVKK